MYALVVSSLAIERARASREASRRLQGKLAVETGAGSLLIDPQLRRTS